MMPTGLGSGGWIDGVTAEQLTSTRYDTSDKEGHPCDCHTSPWRKA